MKKVLVTDDVHPLLMKGLEALGFTCFYQPDITNEAVHEVIHDYEGLIINSKIMVDKALLDSLCKEILILHPGPINRGVEMTSDVADSQQSLILNQVENGVAIRMAVIYLLASKIQ